LKQQNSTPASGAEQKDKIWSKYSSPAPSGKKSVNADAWAQNSNPGLLASIVKTATSTPKSDKSDKTKGTFFERFEKETGGSIFNSLKKTKTDPQSKDSPLAKAVASSGLIVNNIESLAVPVKISEIQPKETLSSDPKANGGFQSALKPAADFKTLLKEANDDTTVRVSDKDEATWKKQEISTGEEGEECVASCRCKLFAFEDGQWKERGVGTLKVNKNENSMYRLLMRTEAVFKLILNVRIFKEMLIQLRDNFVEIAAFEDGKLKKFLIKLRNNSISEEMYQKLKDVSQDS
jgi:hypothetical protein